MPTRGGSRKILRGGYIIQLQAKVSSAVVNRGVKC